MVNSIIEQVIARLPEEILSSLNLTDENNLLFATINVIEERLNEIENKVFGNKRKSETTRKQQILILKHLGFFENLKSLQINETQKALLISILINSSFDNVVKDLRQIDNEKKSDLLTESNYEFLKLTFEKTGAKDKLKEVELKLNEIKQRKKY